MEDDTLLPSDCRHHDPHVHNSDDVYQLPAPALSTTSRRRLIFEKRLRAIRRLAPLASLFQMLTWFIDACALAWGTAVLLGAFAVDPVLSTYHFYAVSALLLAEVIRFWMTAALLRRHHTMSPYLRRILSILQTFLALAIMLTSMYFPLLALTSNTVYNETRCDSKYGRIHNSLIAFYAMMGFNAWMALVLINWSTTIRNIFMSGRSLRRYHDKLMAQQEEIGEEGEGLSAGQIMNMLRAEYRAAEFGANGGESCARLEVCKAYGDALWYMYTDGRAAERVEAALQEDGAADAYEKEAAADVVGFWAVMESLEAEALPRLALHQRHRLLRRLAHVAAHNYGPAGSAAAHSFALLFTHSHITSMLPLLRIPCSDRQTQQHHHHPPWPPSNNHNTHTSCWAEPLPDIITLLLDRIVESPPMLIHSLADAINGFPIVRRTGTTAAAAWPPESIHHMFALQQLVYRLLDTKLDRHQPQPPSTAGGVATRWADFACRELARSLQKPLFSIATAIGIAGEIASAENGDGDGDGERRERTRFSSAEGHMDLLDMQELLFAVFPPSLQSVLQSRRSEVVRLLAQPPEKVARRIRPITICCNLLLTLGITSGIGFILWVVCKYNRYSFSC